MSGYLFTSESVGIGHPDKICDQISDAILDACIQVDKRARVACETLVSSGSARISPNISGNSKDLTRICDESGLVVLAGEITTLTEVDYSAVARKTIQEIGYDNTELGFDYKTCAIMISINKQSEDIARGLSQKMSLFKQQGAGDQGLMFGYASEETKELMPLPIMLSHKLVRELYERRIHKQIPFLRPDAKTQVTIEYDQHHRPKRVHAIVLSTQHTPETSHEEVVREVKKLIIETIPESLFDANTTFFINPTGRFVIGGPQGDCGVTGRKTAVDSYGGMAHHGGGAFSGKDPTKVDRSGSYAARYVAKNIVAAQLAKRCEVQISYAIGVPYPISIRIDTFGTGKVSEELLSRMVPKVFDLSPYGIIEMLNLYRPIYQRTAFGGHFGREEEGFTWEKTDKVDAIHNAL